MKILNFLMMLLGYGITLAMIKTAIEETIRWKKIKQHKLKWSKK